jgi:hypothetical protein
MLSSAALIGRGTDSKPQQDSSRGVMPESGRAQAIKRPSSSGRSIASSSRTCSLSSMSGECAKPLQAACKRFASERCRFVPRPATWAGGDPLYTCMRLNEAAPDGSVGRVAMQKVVGSSPIIRFRKAPHSAVSCRPPGE